MYNSTNTPPRVPCQEWKTSCQIRRWGFRRRRRPEGRTGSAGASLHCMKRRERAPAPHIPLSYVVFWLEERGWTALPVLVFFFRDIFHVVDIGAGLHQDVVQVVPDADEGEALLQELANARCAEQEDSEDQFIFAGVLDQLLGGGIEFGRSVHMREFVLFVEAHGHAQVVLSQEKNIHTGHGGNLRDVLDARSCLYLQSDDAVVVVVTGISEQAGLVHAALWEVDRARADGGILGATHGLPRFFGSVDVGDQNAVGAHVEGLLNSRTIVVSTHPHQ